MDIHTTQLLDDETVEGALTIPAAVAWSGLSRTKIYELAASGRLRTTTVGRRRLVLRRSLRRLLAEGVD